MKAIAAMDPYRVIGFHDKIPWFYPEDYKWFKECTLNQTIIVGYNTFQGLPPLKDRNIVVIDYFSTQNSGRKISNARGAVGVTRTFSTDKSWLAEAYHNVDGWLCGGAKAYQMLLPYCSEVYMTHILDEYEGDVYMPEFESMFPNQTLLRETKDFWIVKYAK